MFVCKFVASARGGFLCLLLTQNSFDCLKKISTTLSAQLSASKNCFRALAHGSRINGDCRLLCGATLPWSLRFFCRRRKSARARQPIHGVTKAGSPIRRRTSFGCFFASLPAV